MFSRTISLEVNPETGNSFCIINAYLFDCSPVRYKKAFNVARISSLITSWKTTSWTKHYKNYQYISSNDFGRAAPDWPINQVRSDIETKPHLRSIHFNYSLQSALMNYITGIPHYLPLLLNHEIKKREPVCWWQRRGY